MSFSSHRHRTHRTGKALATLVLVLLAAGGAAIGTWMYARHLDEKAKADAGKAYQDSAMRVAGLDRPVSNRLDARFADADGNLVADPPATGAVSPDPIVFSYIAVEEADEYAAAWRPFVEHLANVTKRKVVYDATLTDVPSQIRALRNGKLHVTGLNSGSVPMAVNACGFVPVAMLPGDDGSGMTRMRIIAPAGSDLKGPADLKGRSLAMTGVQSNSGFKAAVVLLRSDFGLVLGRDYDTSFTGSHGASIAGVKAKKVAAAAVADDMLMRVTAAGEISPGDYKSLYESERFPAAALGYANNLDPDLAGKVAEAIRTFDWKGTPLEKELGEAHTKFVKADYKNHWSLIRRIDDETGTKHVVEPAGSPATAPAAAGK